MIDRSKYVRFEVMDDPTLTHLWVMPSQVAGITRSADGHARLLVQQFSYKVKATPAVAAAKLGNEFPMEEV